MPKKRKTVRKSTKTTRKSAKQHPKHFLKVYWPYIPIIGVVLFGMVFGNVNPKKQNSEPATLAYSTEMSISGLLNSTNAKRAANGLGALTLNSKLNSSAQAKSSHMVVNDYWSHNTPDGQEPWVFFDAAGYSYQKAGENLAYGFSTSSETVVGWMNSPSHRANILDTSYQEVGFGFTNSPNFVGTGQETVVVAHYGKPTVTTAPPAPAAAEPAQAPSEPQALPSSANNIQPVAEPEEKPVVQEPEELKPLPEDRINQPINSDSKVPENAESQNITRAQSITQGRTPWISLAISIVSISVVLIWLVRHAVLVKRFVHKGEHFVAHHPILDLLVISVAAVAIYLSQSTGVVL